MTEQETKIKLTGSEASETSEIGTSGGCVTQVVIVVATRKPTMKLPSRRIQEALTFSEKK